MEHWFTIGTQFWTCPANWPLRPVSGWDGAEQADLHGKSWVGQVQDKQREKLPILDCRQNNLHNNILIWLHYGLKQRGLGTSVQVVELPCRWKLCSMIVHLPIGFTWWLKRALDWPGSHFCDIHLRTTNKASVRAIPWKGQKASLCVCVHYWRLFLRRESFKNRICCSLLKSAIVREFCRGLREKWRQRFELYLAAIGADKTKSVFLPLVGKGTL